MRNPVTSVLRPLWTAALALVVLALAACGGDDTTTAPSDAVPASEPAGIAGTDDHHDHGTSVEVAEGMPVPTIAIDISEDPVEGWNLHIRTTDFRIVPENVSTAHVDGEGHMHLYIDGEKVSRLYGEWHHIGSLAPGEHEVRVELSANDHSALAVDGDIIDATAVIVAAETDGHAMDHGHAATREAQEPYPSLSVELVDDPAGGWSLHAVPSNFRLAPENASGDHVDGEGHMHLYINGDMVARVYDTWYQIPPLPAGTHEVTVVLRANDHAPITAGGVAVEATTTLEVSEDEATLPAGGHHDEGRGPHGEDDHHGEASGHHHGEEDSHHDEDSGHHHGEDGHHGEDSGHHHGESGGHAQAGAPSEYDADVSEAAQTIVVEAVNGAPEGGVRRVEVDLGSVVALMVTSDIAEEVHVHGYDILRAVSEGHPAHFAFTADIPGVFEVEFEGSGRLLLLLEIS